MIKCKKCKKEIKEGTFCAECFAVLMDPRQRDQKKQNPLNGDFMDFFDKMFGGGLGGKNGKH